MVRGSNPGFDIRIAFDSQVVPAVCRHAVEYLRHYRAWMAGIRVLQDIQEQARARANVLGELRAVHHGLVDLALGHDVRPKEVQVVGPAQQVPVARRPRSLPAPKLRKDVYFFFDVFVPPDFGIRAKSRYEFCQL